MIDIEKAIQALAALEREKQAQRERLKLAAEVKIVLDKTINKNTKRYRLC